MPHEDSVTLIEPSFFVEKFLHGLQKYKKFSAVGMFAEELIEADQQRSCGLCFHSEQSLVVILILDDTASASARGPGGCYL